MGDMNCKIGDIMDGNKEEISKGGKIMIKENNMIILNSRMRRSDGITHQIFLIAM